MAAGCVLCWGAVAAASAAGAGVCSAGVAAAADCSVLAESVAVVPGVGVETRAAFSASCSLVWLAHIQLRPNKATQEDTTMTDVLSIKLSLLG